MSITNTYGLGWEERYAQIDVEMAMIRFGGYFPHPETGFMCGKGLFHHYKALQIELWGDTEDHHRWSDLELKTILENRLTVIAGARDTGKTHVALSRFALTDYFTFPNTTLILISSTDSRGLELRVWGDIKDLFERAKARHKWLPGNVVDAKKGLFTDALDSNNEIRDMRKGIIGIPCLGTKGEWIGGLEKYYGIKQKRRRLLADELQFMQRPFLDSLANLDKGDFKCVGVGNPIGQGDPLDKMSEPVGGWDSMGEITKTITWKNRFGGITLNLVGTDSPNFDKETWNKYPYLIDQSDVERVKERYGMDSMQYWSQIMGVRKAGLDAHRVLTRALCERNDAYKEVIWDGAESRTKVYALDAAFGGDRCVGGWIEFGKETNGPIVIRVSPPKEFKIEISGGQTPEEQIAQEVKSDITYSGIPSANVFFDAGMRATLATEISKVVGTDVNAVNFQGNPTARPVSADDFVFDEKSQSKRLKRCDEHYSKFVTELWFSVRYAVLSRQVRELPTDVAEEFFMREWIKVTGDRYEMESKTDMKERVGYSPDLADWLAIAVEGARRLGFVIERLNSVGVKRTEMDDWLERELSQHRQMMRKTQLTYT